MLFLISWSCRPERRNEAIDRFLKTGGQPPQGVKMLGRWHAIGPITGFALADAQDAGALDKWVLDWNDIFEMEVRPALTDEQLGAALTALRQRTV